MSTAPKEPLTPGDPNSACHGFQASNLGESKEQPDESQEGPESCSFCHKPRREIMKLIAPQGVEGVYICDECVGLCVEILAADSLPAVKMPKLDEAVFGYRSLLPDSVQPFVTRLIKAAREDFVNLQKKVENKT